MLQAIEIACQASYLWLRPTPQEQTRPANDVKGEKTTVLRLQFR